MHPLPTADSISAPSNPACRAWSDFLIFRHTSMNVAVNRAAGEFPEHDHEFGEIALVLAGTAEHHIDGGSHRIHYGDFVVAAPGVSHAYSDAVAFRRINVQVRRAHYLKIVEEWRRTGVDPGLLDGHFARWRAAGQIQPLAPVAFRDCLRGAEAMEREWLEGPAGCGMMLECKLNELLVKLLRYSSAATDMQADDSRFLREAIAYVDRNYPRPVAIAELAAMARMSRRTLVRKFLETTGLSPKQYLMQTRLAWACRKFAAGHGAIQRVAGDCGFADANYFARVFRQNLGVTPRDYLRGNGRR